MESEIKNVYKFIKNITLVSVLVAIASLMLACSSSDGGGSPPAGGGSTPVEGEYWLLSSSSLERDGITDFRIAFDNTWNVTAISYVADGATSSFTSAQMTQISGDLDSDNWFEVEVEWQNNDNNVVFKGGMNAGLDFASGTLAWNIYTNEGLQVGILDSATLTKAGGSNDTTAPSNVMITSPADGMVYDTVGTVTITANADDDTGVTKVEFYRNDVLRATDTAAPYEWTTDLTAASNGTYALVARAYDAAGNVTSSAPVNVTVNIPGGGGVTPTGATWLIISDLLAKQSVTDFRMTFDDNLVITEISYFLNGSARRFTASEITRSGADVDANGIDVDIEADWGTNNSGLVFGGQLNQTPDATSATGRLVINIDDGAVNVFDASTTLTRQ